MLEEIIIILVLALLIFGPKKLPDIAREIGKIVGEYRRIVRELEAEIDIERNLEYQSKNGKKKTEERNKNK